MISARTVAGAHAAYYVLTGAWSIAHRRSFERVTGPKRDYWLVRLVGGLAAAIGLTLGTGVLEGRRRGQTVVLAMGTGAAFVLGDIHAARVSSRAYLADVALHAVFLPAWLRRWPRPAAVPRVRGGRAPGGRRGALRAP